MRTFSRKRERPLHYQKRGCSRGKREGWGERELNPPLMEWWNSAAFRFSHQFCSYLLSFLVQPFDFGVPSGAASVFFFFLSFFASQINKIGINEYLYIFEMVKIEI